MKLNLGNTMSTWLATWAADVISKYRVRSCGQTSFEKMTHHRCRHLAIGFAEKVHFQHTKIVKDSYRKDVGIFLGVNHRCNTYLVGTADGVFASPHIVRFPDESAYDAELVQTIACGIMTT